jgi:uncharacterized protein (TIGR00661 family)
MARIIYAVAGEGFVHSRRAHLIGERLIEAGNEVIFAASEKSLVYLRQYFGQRVKPGFGLSFAYRKGRVKTLGTVKKNLFKFPSAVRESKELFRKHLKDFEPDIVLTDFEPVTAWWAFVKKVPFVSIDNEHLLTVCRLEHKLKNIWPRFTSYVVTKSYYFGADKYIVLNFFAAPLKIKNACIAPPIIRPVVTQLKAWPLKTDSNGSIVYYTTTAYGKDRLVRQFGKFPSQRFIIYGFDTNEEYGNCTFKKRSTEGFLSDLAASSGVIASAGFSLISECLYLKKKMLLLPIPGQYEQIINAQYVEKFGLGIKADRLDESVLKRFLNDLDKPIRDDERILWPDNEKFFGILQEVFDSMLMPIKVS